MLWHKLGGVHPTSTTYFILFRGLEPILAVTGWEAGGTVDRLQVHHRATQKQTGQISTHAQLSMDNLEIWVSLTCKLLWKEAGISEWTHTNVGRACKIQRRNQPSTNTKLEIFLRWQLTVNWSASVNVVHYIHAFTDIPERLLHT